MIELIDLWDPKEESQMTLLDALEYLKNRITRLSLNHKIGNRDIAKLEVKDIVMGIETHVIPTLEKALEHAKKVEELLGLYREHYKLVPFTPGLGDKSKRVCDISIEIKQKEKELKGMK